MQCRHPLQMPGNLRADLAGPAIGRIRAARRGAIRRSGGKVVLAGQTALDTARSEALPGGDWFAADRAPEVAWLWRRRVDAVGLGRATKYDPAGDGPANDSADF